MPATLDKSDDLKSPANIGPFESEYFGKNSAFVQVNIANLALLRFFLLRYLASLCHGDVSGRKYDGSIAAQDSLSGAPAAIARVKNAINRKQLAQSGHQPGISWRPVRS
jgi:hypothetical protein